MKKIFLLLTNCFVLGSIAQVCSVNITANPICASQISTLTVQAPSFSCSSSLPSNLQTSLACYLPFCGNANDISGNGNNGTVNGASLTTDRFGNPNSAYSFNGTNSFIQVPHSASFTYSNNIISIGFWMQVSAWPTNSLEYYILAKHSGVGNTQMGYHSYVYNSFLNIRYRDGVSGTWGSASNNTTTLPAPGTWFHVVYTVNGTSNKMYINGILVDTQVAQIIGANTSDLFIGYDPVGGQYYSGLLDDIVIYNKVLSLTDVQQLYKLGTNTFSWSNGATTNSIIVNPTVTTTYSVTSSNGYSSCSSVETVTVNSCTSNALCFNNATNFSSGNFPSSLASADFNGDGNKDLVVTNQTSNSISVLLGTGNGSFVLANNFNVGSQPNCAVTGDFNSDGKLDIATANQGSNDISIMLGTGTGSFSTATNFSGGNYPNFMVSSDFNGDGEIDFVVTDNASNTVSVFLGTGTGSFSLAASFPAMSNPTHLICADLNSDTKIDLSVSNGSANNIVVLLGTGSGTFGAPTSFNVGSAPYWIASGDFNGDSKIDLATSNQASNNVSILLGTGTGSFTTATNFTTTTLPGMIISTDINNDSKVDLAIVNPASNKVSLLLGNGVGGFGVANTYSVGTYPYFICSGDFNGDGKIDLATSNEISNNTSILLNCSISTNLVSENSVNKNINIFPNPNNGTFTIDVQMKIQNGTLFIYDYIGKEVFKQLVLDGENFIETTELSSGLYLYSIYEGKQKLMTGKLIIN
jgi:hypothetical protein